MTEQKNLGNVIGGHKATLNNPNVSEEAKEHSREVLEEYGVETNDENKTNKTSDTNDTETSDNSETVDGKYLGNVLRGHKAAVNNPRVSEEAKEHSQAVLEEHGAA